MRRESYIKKTTLVAGVDGFNDSYLVVRRLSDVAKQVVIVDKLFMDSRENIGSAVA